MADATKDERDDGMRHAIALVDHLDRMGCATSCLIPVVDRAVEYVVGFIPRAPVQPVTKRENDMRKLRTAAWPESGRNWPDEIVLDVGSDMPTDVYAVRNNAFGVMYIRHDLATPLPDLSKSKWSYSTYRAQLLLDKKFFALVTEDGKNDLPPEKVRQLLEALCQQKLKDLQEAVQLHASEMDAIMAASPSYERGQLMAKSLGRLEEARRNSASTSPVSVSTQGSVSEATAKSKSPPASTATSTRRRKRLKIS